MPLRGALYITNPVLLIFSLVSKNGDMVSWIVSKKVVIVLDLWKSLAFSLVILSPQFYDSALRICRFSLKVESTVLISLPLAPSMALPSGLPSPPFLLIPGQSLASILYFITAVATSLTPNRHFAITIFNCFSGLYVFIS